MGITKYRFRKNYHLFGSIIYWESPRIFTNLLGMTHPRILCLDIGLKRTGVAVCDETRTLASPVTVIDSTHRKKWVAEVARLIESTESGMCVVGLPLNQDGEPGRDAEVIRRFIAALRESVSVPVIEWDERFTTVQAEQALIEAQYSWKERKSIIDQAAAAIILQSYLDNLSFNRNS